MGIVALRHRESSWTRNQTHVPCVGRWVLIHSATREVLLPQFYRGVNWGKKRLRTCPWSLGRRQSWVLNPGYLTLVYAFNNMKRRFLAFSFYLFCHSKVDLQSCINFCYSRIFYLLFSHFQEPLCQSHRGRNNTKMYPIALATFGVSNYMIFFIKQENNLEAILTNLLIKTKLMCLFQWYYI